MSLKVCVLPHATLSAKRPKVFTLYKVSKVFIYIPLLGPLLGPSTDPALMVMSINIEGLSSAKQ